MALSRHAQSRIAAQTLVRVLMGSIRPKPYSTLLFIAIKRPRSVLPRQFLPSLFASKLLNYSTTMLSPTQQRRYGSEYSYWANAEMEARVQVRSLKSEADLAMREDVGEGRLTATEWWATDEGIRILEHIEAATLEADIYAKQDDRVKQGSAEACAFTSLFAETKLGLGIRKPSKSQRLEFRESLIQFYNAAVGTHPRNPKHFLTLHDTAGGQNMICSSVTAVYLVPYKLNSDLRAVIYGEDVEDEIMRVRLCHFL